jgi:hypothetical protein
MAMHRLSIGRMPLGAMFLATALWSGRASAQDVNPPAGGAGLQGPMTVERVREGWAIAPDFKVTRFDDSTRGLAGVWAGWVIDNTLMIGGAGYWLPDSSRARGLSYGGALIEWREHTERTFGFSVKALLGFGTATVPRTVTLIPFGRYPGVVPVSTNGSLTFAFREDFFVAEPQADLLVSIAPRVRLHVGAGYRAVGGAGSLGSAIRGATGSVSLEIGPSSQP